MLGLFQRPKLDARFAPSHAHSDEIAREIAVAGRLVIANEGSDAELSDVEMMVIAGFRRIPLEVPSEWRNLRLAKGSSKESAVEWTITLDAPLRAQAGELWVSVRDQKRRKSEWRLPFSFELR
jgi:hypothetical protein